jgi:hypothetical protein
MMCYSSDHHEQMLRQMTRNAPAWVLRKANEERRRLGYSELRGGQFEVLQKPRKLVKQGLGTLVGLATYGEGLPTKCDWDTRNIPERFAATAFADSVEEINRGVSSAFLALGHTVEEIANTDDDTLGLFVHPIAGLEFWAKLPNTPAHVNVCRLARNKRLGVSVGFLPLDFESRPLKNGGRYRLITRATLHHIALLDTVKQRPSYRSAKVEHIWEADTDSISNALATVRVTSKISALEQKLRRF